GEGRRGGAEPGWVSLQRQRAPKRRRCTAAGLPHPDRFAVFPPQEGRDYAARAFDRSAIRSLAASTPMERRIRPSEMPMARRAASGTPECVVLPGWQARDSVPPRLTACLNTCRRSRTRKAAGCPPATVKEEV